MIEVKNLKKAFGDVQAVRDVSFRATNGRVTGLLGPNGAGKSTTLRMLYTVLRPDAGSAHVDGVSALDDPLGVRARMGALPHGAGLYPQLTARENIAYFGALQGLGGATLDWQVDKMIDLLDIAEFADRRTKGFSQGQRTKVALARAIVHEPDNILLDEPTNGLDVMAIRSLRELIKRLRDSGKCVLFSSHVMQEVAAICDDIVIIAAGKVASVGSPDALRAEAGTEDLEEVFIRAIERAETPS